MGLQGQVTDCSSESIFILIVSIVANCVIHLRSVLFQVFRSTGFSRIEQDEVDEGLLGSGLAGLIVLSEQLKLNRSLSYQFGGAEPAGSECVVCLCKLREGQMVRRLGCRHVFHKECFDGWLDHLHFSCPLCRSPLVTAERVEKTERRVSHDLLGFFSLQ